MNQANQIMNLADEEGEPTWEIAYLFPAQGSWSVADYLELDGNYLVEFSNGFLEVLPMPTTSHQLIVAYYYGLLLSFTAARDLGPVLFAPLRIRLGPRKYREPDVLFVKKEHATWIGEQFWKKADLVMEVVSGGARDRQRDLVIKREEYARAGIAEYWIIDPEEEQITVFRLEGKHYVVHGEFSRGETASSPLLPGFTVEVDKVFSQEPRPVENAASRTRRRSRK